MPLVVSGVVVLLVAAVLATGLGWPGWMGSATGRTAAAPVDLATPDAAAGAVVDALNRRDIEQFVGSLVCADGRSTGDDGETTLAEETLYRDIAPFDPSSDAAVGEVTPAFTIDEVRGIRPSDIGYAEEMTEAQVAIVSVAYPNAPAQLRSELRDQRGVLTMVPENGSWVVCEMGFVPVGSVPGEVAPDPDPASPTGRAQAFIAAVNAKDIATARIYMCATASAVNRLAEDAIAEGATLRLNQPADTFGSPAEPTAQLQVWHTLGDEERRAGGFMSKESDGWCVMSLGVVG